MTHTATYDQRKSYVKYDSGHWLLYLNEAPGEITDRRTKEKRPGISYTGTMKGGGTLIEATGVTDGNRRDKFVAGLIGTHYDKDAQIAILANGSDTPEHAKELAEFAEVRRRCKEQVDELLARNL